MGCMVIEVSVLRCQAAANMVSSKEMIEEI
jgi:hypothetical protein